jgi:E3 ubiquitin-protein ligase synoviolin
MSRLLTFGAINFAALSVAILHAYKLNETFYASSVYFAQSRLSMIILGSWGLYCLFLAASAVKNIFLGSLRIIEIEVSRGWLLATFPKLLRFQHINEYSWITLSETFLAMTIFKDEIDSTFIFAFSFLMTIRVFHWILRDRIEFVSAELVS